jgi:hypothetical protein
LASLLEASLPEAGFLDAGLLEASLLEASLEASLLEASLLEASLLCGRRQGYVSNGRGGLFCGSPCFASTTSQAKRIRSIERERERQRGV